MKNNLAHICWLRHVSINLFFVLGSSLLASSAYAISVVENITTDTTWDNTTEAYVIGSDIIIAETITLTITTGVTVLFEQNAKLTVSGTLYANTLSTVPITFAAADSTSRWNGIEFTDSSADILFDGEGNYVSGSLLKYVTISGVGTTALGAIKLANAFPGLSFLTIQNNDTSGLYANITSLNTAPAVLKISNSTIQANTITGRPNSPGISIFSDDLTTIEISNNSIKNNSDTAYTNDLTVSAFKAEGGGILVQGGKVINIVGNTLTSNKAALGGAISIKNSTTAISPNAFVKDNIISSNSAKNGGGIYIVSSNVDVSNNQILGNHTIQQGGGVFIAISSNPSKPSGANIYLNHFIKNTAINTGGGGYIDGTTSTLNFNNNISYMNTTEEHGGAFDLHNAVDAKFNNNIFVSNTAQNGGDVINIGGGSGSISNNSIQGIGASKLLVMGSGPTELYSITNNSIISNSNVVTLIHVDNASSTIINNNNMFNNSGVFVFNDQTATILNATSNWWGGTNDSAIKNLVGGFGTATVDVSSPLTGFNNSAPISHPVGLFVKQTTDGIGVTWAANTESNLAGYRVFWGTSSISESNDLRYEQSADVGNLTGYTIPGSTLLGGTQYFIAVTAYDNTRIESEDISSTIVNDNMVAGKESWFSREYTATSKATAVNDDGGGSNDFLWLSFMVVVIIFRKLAQNGDRQTVRIN